MVIQTLLHRNVRIDFSTLATANAPVFKHLECLHSSRQTRLYVDVRCPLRQDMVAGLTALVIEGWNGSRRPNEATDICFAATRITPPLSRTRECHPRVAPNGFEATWGSRAERSGSDQFDLCIREQETQRRRDDMSLIINISSFQPAFSATSYQSISDAQQEALRTRDAQSAHTPRDGARSAVSRAADQSSFRIARTAAVREEIASGTYETPERIEGTVDRILDILA